MSMENSESPSNATRIIYRITALEESLSRNMNIPEHEKTPLLIELEENYKELLKYSNHAINTRTYPSKINIRKETLSIIETAV